MAYGYGGGLTRRDVTNKVQRKNVTTVTTPLQIGFVPLTDCAPLVMAQELGLFRKYGLRVKLHRELGWATIRDKVIHGELDAAHALAAMPVAATVGLNSIASDCVTGLVLNLHGNAITLSNDLRERGVRDGASLRQTILQLRSKKTFVFGAVAPFSSHFFLLRKWLMSFGIHPGRDVRIVIVPPPQMVMNLKAGHLDGFCVGEPWNSVAVRSRVGWCAAVSAELAPGHPEKVLMVRRDFAEKRAEEHLALLAAVLEACAFCDDRQNHEQLAGTLARPEYVGVPESDLRRGTGHEFDFGDGRVRTVQDFTIFHRHDANEPSAEKSAWVLQQMREVVTGQEPGIFNAALGRRVFRNDLFEKAVRLRASQEAKGESDNISMSV
jgi:ABC-type nitrate/sulfonate/bicarbonate transport system substrate-binding protein